MDHIEKLFAPDSTGKVAKHPLEAMGFRFDAKNKTWRTVTRFHDSLPKNVTRCRVATEVGVSEQLLEDWEKAICDQDASEAVGNDPVDLLRVDQPQLNKDPLSAWQLRYYPQSKVWRRTRSHRNEVSRLEVARKIGVPEDLILKWELAMNSEWSSGESSGSD
jgi:hypothetical protein